MEIGAIAAKNQVGKEEMRVKLKLFGTCLMTALIYGMEAWGNIRLVEMREIEKIQGKALKKIFQLQLSNSLYWYHNGNRNMASRAKTPICYNGALSQHKKQ